MTIYATPPDGRSAAELALGRADAPVMPEGAIQPGGWTLVRHRYHRDEQRQRLIADYLHPVELDVHASLAEERRMPWLLGRVAAKDAVIDRLAGAGYAVVPRHFAVVDDEGARPRVLGLQELVPTLGVSIAHLDGCAVAITADSADVGVGIEAVEERPPSFSRVAFTRTERAGRHLAGVDDRTWMTAAWCAKRAVGRSLGLELEPGADGDTPDGAAGLETRVVGPGLIAVDDRIVRWVQLDSATATSATGRSVIVGWTVVPQSIIELDRRGS
jgi:hypothetical protein